MGRTILYLSAQDVLQTGISISEVLERTEYVFRAKAAGTTEMPAKIGIHPTRTSFLHAMPAWIAALPAAGVKWVGAYPENIERSLPQVHGTIILSDAGTGAPMAVLDAAWITASRTAAASVLAARSLAKPDAGRLAVLGCGIQGASHLEYFSHAFALTEVRTYDPNPDASARLARRAEEEFGVCGQTAASPEEAVRGSDLVVTAGPIRMSEPGAIAASWVAPGTCSVSIDFASYWSADALRSMDRLCTDDRLQLSLYRDLGYFAHLPEGALELADLVSGQECGRTTKTQRTFACLLGLALEDVGLADLVVSRARAAGLGRELEQ